MRQTAHPTGAAAPLAPACPPLTPSHWARSLPRKLLWLLGQRLALQRHRRHLTRLDARLCADIGLSPDAAQTEGNRPIWDAPVHWRDALRTDGRL